MRPMGTGQWVHMSLIGKLIQASHHPHQDGISNFNLMGYNMVHKMAFNFMDLLDHRTVRKVGAG